MTFEGGGGGIIEDILQQGDYRMKKILAVCFCTIVVSAYSFAEFVISPSVGYSNHFALGWKDIEVSVPLFGQEIIQLTDRNSWHAFAIGLDAGFIGKSGFSFFFNNSVSLAGVWQKDITARATSSTGSNTSINLKAQKLKGAYWDGELLFGYTFKQVPNLYVTLAGGVGAGGTFSIVPEKVEFKGRSVDTKDLITIGGFNIGFALHAEAAYYFTKNIGLALSVTETPGYGVVFASVNKDSLAGSLIDDKYLNAKGGFVNALHVKLGPTFKF